MSTDAERQWDALRRDHPAMARALSPLGREAAFPLDIPAQAAEARGKDINATIGQITDGRGRPLALPAVATALEGVDDRDRALLYSPVEGIDDLRRAWRRWQRRSVGEGLASSMPFVTVGLTHGLSLISDLFAGASTPVVVPTPFWGNYRQTFALRRGARMVEESAYRDAVFDPQAWARGLSGLEGEAPGIAILNFPSNPGGYFPTASERQALIEGLLEAADRRPLVTIFDDAYAGLVYDPGCDPRSLFWDAVAAGHPNLIPVKVDGGTKEFGLFGGRVGFLTFGVEPDGEVASILESKLKCLSRATLGSPVSTSQVALLQALEAEDIERQVEMVRRQLDARWRRLSAALESVDRGLLRPLPSNAGCFAMVEIEESLGLSAEQARRRLLDVESVGVVSIAPRYLRIAFCSLAEEDIERTVEAIERAVLDLAVFKTSPYGA